MRVDGPTSRMALNAPLWHLIVMSLVSDIFVSLTLAHGESDDPRLPRLRSKKPDTRIEPLEYRTYYGTERSVNRKNMPAKNFICRR